MAITIATALIFPLRLMIDKKNFNHFTEVTGEILRGWHEN